MRTWRLIQQALRYFSHQWGWHWAADGLTSLPSIWSCWLFGSWGFKLDPWPSAACHPLTLTLIPMSLLSSFIKESQEKKSKNKCAAFQMPCAFFCSLTFLIECLWNWQPDKTTIFKYLEFCENKMFFFLISLTFHWQNVPMYPKEI